MNDDSILKAKAEKKAKKRGYVEIPDAQQPLQCYTCNRETAVLGRTMKTPSGGEYWRGYCIACLAGVKTRGGGSAAEGTGRISPAAERDRLNEIMRAYESPPVPVQTPVFVCFHGRVLQYSPNGQSVQVLVGTTAFDVPTDALIPVLGSVYTVEESEMRGEVRVITKATLHEVSIGGSPVPVSGVHA